MPDHDELTYTIHAKERMELHKVSEEDSHFILKNPHNEYISKGNNIAEHLTSNRSTIRGVYSEVPSITGGKTLHIITVIRMSGDRMKRGRK